jgi:allantoin racemase
MTRICFLNPFGTDDYDPIIQETLTPSLRTGTELEIRHLPAGPRNIDYYVPKHLSEVEILKSVVAAEQDGFDAFVIGCCYDPALTQARELASIPVIGPLEASVLLSRLFGHRFAVITDHHKAVPEIEDRVRLYGVEANCRSVTAIEWFVDDMLGDSERVARDLYVRAGEVLERDRAEVVVVGCTIVSACFEQAVLRGASELADRAIVNPNLMAVKLAELFADLNAVGQYRMARAGYYEQHARHDPREAADVLGMLEDSGLSRSEATRK